MDAKVKKLTAFGCDSREIDDMGYRRFRRPLPLGEWQTSVGARRSGFMARGVGEEEGFKNEVEDLDMHRVENSIFAFREFS